MSIGFLAGIRGISSKRTATMPHSEITNYQRRKEMSYIDWLEIWKEVLPKDEYEKRSTALKKLTSEAAHGIASRTDFKE